MPPETDSHAERTDLLLEEVSPELYRANAFRVLGLGVSATPQQIRRRIRQISIGQRFGREAVASGNGVLPLVPPPEGDAIRDARQRLREPTLRLLDEVFWFWPHSPEASERDDPALLALQEGNYEAAAVMWRERGKQRNDGMVATHNLAVLAHALALDLEFSGQRDPLRPKLVEGKQYYWQVAYAEWRRCLEEEGFWRRLVGRIRELDDPRLTTGTGRRLRASLPLAILSINAGLAVRAAERDDGAEVARQLRTMRDSGFSSDVVEDALRRATVAVRDRVKLRADAARNEADANPEQADRIGQALVEDTRQPLGVIDSLLPDTHTHRQAVHDEVALSVLHTQVAYCNRTSRWRPAVATLERALAIASSDSARQRIATNLEAARNNLEGDTCWFCRQAPRNDDAAIEVKMHGNVVRTPTWNGTRITWQHSTIRVPRCAGCKDAHGRIGNWSAAGCFLGGLAGLGPLILLGILGDCAGWFFGILLMVAAIGIGVHLGEQRGKRDVPAHIKPESASNEYPAVKKLRDQGWQSGDRPSGA